MPCDYHRDSAKSIMICDYHTAEAVYRVVTESGTNALNFDHISQAMHLIKRRELLKKRQQGKNAVAYAKSHASKPRLDT